jgi:hypothetical protein
MFIEDSVSNSMELSPALTSSIDSSASSSNYYTSNAVSTDRTIDSSTLAIEVSSGVTDVISTVLDSSTDPPVSAIILTKCSTFEKINGKSNF